MKQNFGLLICVVLVVVALAQRAAGAGETTRSKGPILTEVLAASKPGDWRSLDPENTLYLELASGRVVIELAPAFPLLDRVFCGQPQYHRRAAGPGGRRPGERTRRSFPGLSGDCREPEGINGDTLSVKAQLLPLFFSGHILSRRPFYFATDLC